MRWQIEPWKQDGDAKGDGEGSNLYHPWKVESKPDFANAAFLNWNRWRGG